MGFERFASVRFEVIVEVVRPDFCPRRSQPTGMHDKQVLQELHQWEQGVEEKWLEGSFHRAIDG